MGLLNLIFGPSKEDIARQEAQKKKADELAAQREEAAKLAESKRLYELFRQYMTDNTKLSAIALETVKRPGHERELRFEIEGATAYMPISQVEIGYCSDLDEYVGKSLSFLVDNVLQNGEVKVSSRRLLMLEDAERRKIEAQRKQAERELYLNDLKELSQRDYVNVIVTSVDYKGANVELEELCGGKKVESWIHLSNLADKFLRDAFEAVQVGKTYKAKLHFDTSLNDFSLSLKDYIVERKAFLFESLTVGLHVNAVVVSIKEHGLVVDLGEGLTGWISSSQLRFGRTDNPSEYFNLGQELDAIITEIDRDNKKISLSVRKYLEETKPKIDISDANFTMDNSDLSYSGPVCIRLNDNRTKFDQVRNNLQECETRLSRLLFGYNQIDADNKLEEILNKVFPDGFSSKIYVRNLSFTSANGRENDALAIRPFISEGCYLQSVLPEGMTLLFKGRIKGKEFVVDAVFDTTDSERLAYEVECDIVSYRDPSRVSHNLFIELSDQATSITKYTTARLSEWEEYLTWKKNIANQQIVGCKYYAVDYTRKDGFLFYLVCDGEESFKSFKKYLSRDLYAYNNFYSTDKWSFKFQQDENRNLRKSRKYDLGRFKGTKFSCYLDEAPSEVLDSLSQEDEAEIRVALELPYLACVSYDLSDELSDKTTEEDVDDIDIEGYIKERILDIYPEQGFLALSGAGQFALIRRFEDAVSNLKDNRYYSPNLPMWLFDATKARLPLDLDSVVINEWLNQGIANNENQKLAVRKMLAAPDLCLIQGPPGTGKTTVIAEAIYQFVKRGNRVLIASQSNDAVDNALDRLSMTPEIRAIRLGQKGRRRSVDSTAKLHKFSESEALRSYYDSLSNSISTEWLNRWESLDSKSDEIEIDIRDCKNNYSDINRLYEKLNSLSDEQSNEEKDLSLKKAQYEKALDKNSLVNIEKNQVKCLREKLEGNNYSLLLLSEEQSDIAKELLNKVFIDSVDLGFKVLPAEIDIVTLSSKAISESITTVFGAIDSLNKAIITLRSSSVSNNDNADTILLLKNQLSDLNTQLGIAFDEDDAEAMDKIKKARKDINNRINELQEGGACSLLSPSESRYFSESSLSLISSGESESVIENIETFVSSWNSACMLLVSRLNSRIEELSSDDLTIIANEIKQHEATLNSIKHDIVDTNDKITTKRSLEQSLSAKYDLNVESLEELAIRLEEIKNSYNEEKLKQDLIRAPWESTMKKFVKRLSDSEYFKYDNEYFKQDYINACNVVGISCTDNMNNLTDNGFNAFDVVIIDEVSKATPPELLIPLMKARKAILVGDHRQLPPMFDEHERSYSELIDDLSLIPEDSRSVMTAENFVRFKGMVTSSLFKEYFESADDSIKHSLLTQYRMHSNIMDLINRFYDHRLMRGLSEDDELRLKAHGLTITGIDGSSFIEPSKHAYWIDSSGLPDGTPIYESFLGNSTSACNFLEIALIIELLKKIAIEARSIGFNKDNRMTIGVISFYQMQVNELRRRFKIAKKDFDFSSLSIDINTVDRFQGKEKNIIITSLVRNNKAARASKHVIAFERINVAFSRAQNMLVIVGAKNLYQNLSVELPNMDSVGTREVPVYKNIIDDLNRKACLRGSAQLIDKEIADKVLKDFEKNKGKVR